MLSKDMFQILWTFLLTLSAISRADIQDICSNLKDGVYLHPEGNSKYIRCFRRHGFQVDCPKGLLFSANKGICMNHSKLQKEAQPCNEWKCKLPNCLCASTNAPGNLTRNEIPQMVMITFDDAVTSWNMEKYRMLFQGRRNPNNCTISGTFFVCNRFTSYKDVNELYEQGHEIADHSITHRTPTTWWKHATYKQWMEEIAGERKYLKTLANITHVYGFRAPFLQIGGNRQFAVLKDLNFLYDSSIPTGGKLYDPPLWPYTLDYRSPQVDFCDIPPCPTDSFPGLWEVPMISYLDKGHFPCAMYDGCVFQPENEEEVYNLFMSNFERHYHSNKAPFPLFGHAAWFGRAEYNFKGFLRFVDEILKKKDVYIVNVAKVIRWMQHPTPLQDLHKFNHWQC